MHEHSNLIQKETGDQYIYNNLLTMLEMFNFSSAWQVNSAPPQADFCMNKQKINFQSWI